MENIYVYTLQKQTCNAQIDHKMNTSEPLRILAIGDYTTKTGLGTALNIPLRKLTERGKVEPDDTPGGPHCRIR